MPGSAVVGAGEVDIEEWKMKTSAKQRGRKPQRNRPDEREHPRIQSEVHKRGAVGLSNFCTLRCPPTAHSWGFRAVLAVFSGPITQPQIPPKPPNRITPSLRCFVVCFIFVTAERFWRCAAFWVVGFSLGLRGFRWVKPDAATPENFPGR